MQAKPCKEARNFKISTHPSNKVAGADKNKANVLHRKALDRFEEMQEAKLLEEELL